MTENANFLSEKRVTETLLGTKEMWTRGFYTSSRSRLSQTDAKAPA